MKTGERAFVVVFGFFLLCAGIYGALLGETSAAWRYIGGGVLFALGTNAVYGGITGKPPWISKIGPLP
jgi:cytochrome c biogenesis protein CcdA